MTDDSLNGAMPPDPFAAPPGPDPVPTPPQLPTHALAQFTIPAAVDMQIADQPGQRMLILRIESVNGSFVFGWPTERAGELGQAMVEAAAKYPNTGLVTATADQMPPPPQPGPNGGVIL